VKKKLNISVRNLVEQVLKTGDLEVGSFRGQSRARDGQKLHQKIQRSRTGNYEAEVHISKTIETDKFLVEISGRIDGLFPDSSPVVIEEIKSVTSDLTRYAEKENILHWGQAKTYAFLYAEAQELDKINVQMTYGELDSGRTAEVVKEFEVNELRVFFQDLLQKYLSWLEKMADWQQIRDRSLTELKFPFDSYRKGQKDLAVNVYRTIKNTGQSMIQAPTGIGKSMAVLYPALKAMAEDHAGKIFYLTARTTGKNAALKAAEIMEERGGRIKYLALTAKEKICFHQVSECSPETCRFARGYYDKLPAAREEIFQFDRLSRERIEEIARKHELCPFEFSLDASLWCDVVIGDYNYAFDLRTKLKRFFGEEQDFKRTKYVFLVDEAHNLVDRSRDMFSAMLNKQSFLKVRRPLKQDLSGLHKIMGKINNWFLAEKKKCLIDKTEHNRNELPVKLIPLLQKFLQMTEKWLAYNIPAEYRKDLLELYFAVHQFVRITEIYDDNYTVILRLAGKDVTLKLFCLNPARQLQLALKAAASAFFFSATLTPMHYFRQVLGCQEEISRLILPSPFPPENLKVAINNISTRYRHRSRTMPDVAGKIRNFLEKRKGNYLVFFPSYKYMNEALDLLQNEELDMDLLIQTSGMTEPERDDFIAEFSHENKKTTVGFAVMGGVFGEGIDLIGNRLDGAVIVGVGLPGLSFERDLIRDYFNKEEKGFEFAYQFPGITRVLQAAGRVIRTETDKGRILLIDDRFSNYSYKRLLPGEWIYNS